MNPGPNGGRWFPGATLNVCVNCLDRHLATVADGVAFHWEGEPGDRRAITYRELHAEVCAFAAALAGLGVGAGDRVALHLGFLPETVVACPATQVHAVYGPLACGATSVIYEGMLDTPSHERAWEIVDRYGVNTILTTPSVVRNLRRWSDSRLSAHDLGSLKRIVTAGERT